MPLAFTASFGVADLDLSDEEFENLLRRTDQAMYVAKQAGRDRVATLAAVEAPER